MDVSDVAIQATRHAPKLPSGPKPGRLRPSMQVAYQLEKRDTTW